MEQNNAALCCCYFFNSVTSRGLVFARMQKATERTQQFIHPETSTPPELALKHMKTLPREGEKSIFRIRKKCERPQLSKYMERKTRH